MAIKIIKNLIDFEIMSAIWLKNHLAYYNTWLVCVGLRLINAQHR